MLDKAAGIVTATDAIESRLLGGEISELDLLYHLFRDKGIMPWEFCGQSIGYQDLVYAMYLHELRDEHSPLNRGYR